MDYMGIVPLCIYVLPKVELFSFILLKHIYFYVSVYDHIPRPITTENEILPIEQQQQIDQKENIDFFIDEILENTFSTSTNGN